MGVGLRIFILLILGLYSPAFAAEDFSAYMEDVRGKIQKSWNPPEHLERDGHALVKFSVTRSGDIYAVQMVESSGDEVFDASAMEALKKASPFAHFPAETARGSLTINYSFDTSFVNTENMQRYLDGANRYYNVNNRMALEYISRAIDEVDGDINAYFLYAKRGKIRGALGDIDGERADMEESQRLKSKYDKKRIMASRLYAELEKSPYSYFALAHTYDVAGDYENAINAINKAIEMTDLNNQYNRYKDELIVKFNKM